MLITLMVNMRFDEEDECIQSMSFLTTPINPVSYNKLEAEYGAYDFIQDRWLMEAGIEHMYYKGSILVPAQEQDKIDFAMEAELIGFFKRRAKKEVLLWKLLE